MSQINYIRNLICKKLNLKLNLSLIEKLGVLDGQIKFIEFNVFFQNILGCDIL